MGKKTTTKETDCCSFCGSPRSEVGVLFAGSDGACICDQCIEHGHSLLEQSKEPELREQYRERLCCINRPVTVISPAGRYEAECVGLDEHAHLLVKTADGQVNALSSGEISIRL